MKRISIFTLSFLFIFSSLFISSSKNSYAYFEQGRIIDNYIFDNMWTMSTNDIQSFLNGFSQSCLKNYQSPYPIDYFNYGSQTSAATVIRRTADLWGLNPQVILATLEKEQSLVSGNAGCDGWRYNSAMGMGCPDSGQCPAPQYAGFSQQVTKGSWQLMFGRQRAEGNVGWNGDGNIYYAGRMTEGYYAKQQGGPLVYNDGYTTIDGVAIYLSTGAAASLYNYTPHFHGNKNFVLIFERWFGPTIGTKIVKKDSSPSFYLLNRGKKIPIPSYDVYTAYGFNKISTTIVPPAYLDGIPTGNALTTLARDSSGNIQLMTRGNRYTLTPEACTAWGLECFNPYVVTDLESDMFTYSTWIRYLPSIMNYNGVVYSLSNGKKSPFLNPVAVGEAGYNMAHAAPVESINAFQALGPLIPSNVSLLRLVDGRKVLSIDGQIIQVSDSQIEKWGLQSIYNPVLPESSWTQTPPANSSILDTNYIQFSTQKVLIDNQRKIDLSSVYNEWPAATEASPFMGKLLDRIPLGNATAKSCFRSEGGDMYVVQAGKRRSFALYNDFYQFGCRSTSLILVDDSSVPMLSRGPALLSHNRLFKSPSNPNIYMQTGPSSSVTIPSMSYITAFNLQVSDVATVDDTTIQSYPSTGTSVSSLGGNYNLGAYFLHSPSGIKYYFDSSTFNAWGINKVTVPTYSDAIGARSLAYPASRFVRTPDGKIFFGSNGSARYIANYEAFLKLNGGQSVVMQALPDFISNLPVGPPIN